VESGQIGAHMPGQDAISPSTTDDQFSGTSSAELVQVAYLIPVGVTPGAVRRYKEAMRKFSVDLARETSRLEEAHRVDDEETIEITASMVAKAAEAVRNPRRDEVVPPSAFALFCPIIAVVCALISGIFGSYLESAWQWSGCGLFGLATVFFMLLSVYEVKRR
jgi:hypothetical protein